MSSKIEKDRPVLTHGSIPDGWTKARIGDICEIVRGVSYKKNQASEQPAEGKVPILRATNVQNAALVLDCDLVYVPSELVSDIQKLRVGDIVVATSSGSKHLVGKTAQVLGSWRGSFGAFCAAIRPKTDIDHRYLGHFFNSSQYKDYISAKALGVNINNLRRGDLEEISVPVAPKVQQQRIVAEIEKQFSRLDEAVATLKRVKANLKRYKASVLKAAVEGKLTEAWRKQHPNVEPASKLLERILAERRAKFGEKKDSFLTAEGDPPGLSPGGWAICSIDQIAECLDAKRVPVNKAERAKRGGNIPYYGANGQVGVIDDYIFDEPLVLVVEDETFTGRTQSFSYMIRGKSWVNNHAHVLRSTSAVTASYLNYGLAYYPFIPRTTGSTGRRKLTQRGLRTAPFLLPPLVEQEQIVAEVERRISVMEELEAAVEANIIRADRLRQSILSTAFSGRLAVSESEIARRANNFIAH